MIQQRAQNWQNLRYFIARNVQIGGNYKNFHFGAIIKFWDKIYTPTIIVNIQKFFQNIVSKIYSTVDIIQKFSNLHNWHFRTNNVELVCIITS